MVRKLVCLATLALVGSAMAITPSWAQYRGYGYSYDSAPDYYQGGGSAYDPFYYPDERRAPAPQAYAPPAAYPDQGASQQPLYVDPADGGRDQGRGRYDLGENANRHTMVEVENPTKQPAGTIVIDTASRHLYLVERDGRALQYGIGVGRQGFSWKGTARVQRKAEWPDWIPPKEMILRRPDLPERMEGGIENPLGARALYLFQGNRDTLFRIHGTNEPDTIGKAVSSGCIRMNNADVIDLYQRVPVGARVVVL
jgi:lipoprotein-anchoring transpeptidase ErfK/SrfK